MKNTSIKSLTKKLTIAFVLLLLSLVLSGCYTPNPLYGTWADNDGNTIAFIQDGTFTAQILNSSDEPIAYGGTYDVVDNVLIFHVTGDKEYSRNTEWDIRGSMLYLSWTANNNTKSLTLYHVAR